MQRKHHIVPPPVLPEKRIKPHSENNDWAPETIEKLRQLWAEGISTIEIGRRLNLSKNAIVGKAHRLHLPARPSPIRRGGQRKPAPLQRQESRKAASAVLVSDSGVMTPAPVLMPYKAPVYRSKECLWPIGEPGKPSFHLCGADGIPGKPYCPAHDAIAYARPARVAAE